MISEEGKAYVRSHEKFGYFLLAIIAVLLFSMSVYGIRSIAISTADRASLHTELDALEKRVDLLQMSINNVVSAEVFNAKMGTMQSKIEDINFMISDVRNDLRDRFRAIFMSVQPAQPAQSPVEAVLRRDKQH